LRGYVVKPQAAPDAKPSRAEFDRNAYQRDYMRDYMTPSTRGRAGSPFG
jgi:hypothetical protein